MKDTIYRQAAIDAIGELCSCTIEEETRWREIIGRIPSVQQEIIRCKDCKHRYVGGNGMTHYYVCDFMAAQYEDEGFCSHAERKDNG